MDCQRDTEARSPLQAQLFSLQGHTPEKPCYFLLILPIIFQMIIRHDQIHIGGACGNATGRNIHQRSLDEAVRLTKAISAITLADYEVADALAVFNGEKDFAL